jgi:hypothetical protein
MRKLLTAVLLFFFIFACKKGSPDTSLTKSKDTQVTVALDQTLPGYSISPRFEGLSFETAVLCRNPEYLNVNNKVYIQLIKNLGPGLLRIGGDTSDEIDWTGAGPINDASKHSLSQAGIDRLAAFSNKTGWPVLLGLNLGSNKLNAAIDEATYAYNKLGDNLYALQAGNEPDIYSLFGLRQPTYGIINFTSDWENYFYSLKTALPKVPFAGPGVSFHADWVTQFASMEGINLKLIDAHYYLTGPASSSEITYLSLLQSNLLPVYLKTLNMASEKSGLPYRITECNNVYGGGRGGVSDVFVSALWALDFMWTVAENNGQGINFHDGQDLYYSPIIIANGNVIAQPEYYAMLAFKYGNNGGRIIRAKLTSTKHNNCTAYACVNKDHSTSVTLINKEQIKDIAFTIKLNNAAKVAQVAWLTAPSLTAKNDVTFAGSAVNIDGNFTPAPPERRTVVNNSFTVKVPTGSAAVITFR